MTEIKTTRRVWLRTVSTAALGTLVASRVSADQETSPVPTDEVPSAGRSGLPHAAYPSQDPAWIRDIVGAAHSDLDRVRELVTARPELAKASYDWGFGDWESALGAASHMGRRDIADLLIEHGARPTIFSSAMLGQLGVVRAFVEASPGIQRVAGPHGFSLLAHARFGGEAAEPVLRYLESLGDADPRPTNVPLEDQEKQAFVGRYDVGAREQDGFEVEINRRGSLAITRHGEPFGRALFYQGADAFHPGGAPSVRVQFERRAGKIVSFAILNPERILTATRRG